MSTEPHKHDWSVIDSYIFGGGHGDYTGDLKIRCSQCGTIDLLQFADWRPIGSDRIVLFHRISKTDFYELHSHVKF